MDDDEKAALARQGMKAVDLAKPGEISRRVKGRVKGAAGNVALRGIAALGRLAGGSAPRSPGRAAAVEAVDFNRTVQGWELDDAAAFEAKLREAAAEKPAAPVYQDEIAAALAEPDSADDGAAHLEHLRRSFPEASRQFALLIFNCVDLLEELADDVEGTPAPGPDLERKERLMLRIAKLIEPQAGVALTSFVEHVVEQSRQSRGE